MGKEKLTWKIKKPEGYRGFCSLVWWLFKTNLRAKKHQKIIDIPVKYEIFLPVKWWK